MRVRSLVVLFCCFCLGQSNQAFATKPCASPTDASFAFTGNIVEVIEPITSSTCSVVNAFGQCLEERKHTKSGFARVMFKIDKHIRNPIEHGQGERFIALSIHNDYIINDNVLITSFGKNEHHDFIIDGFCGGITALEEAQSLIEQLTVSPAQ